MSKKKRHDKLSICQVLPKSFKLEECSVLRLTVIPTLLRMILRFSLQFRTEG